MTKEEIYQIFGYTTVGYWINDGQVVYSYIHPDKDIWSLWIFEGIYSEALEDGKTIDDRCKECKKDWTKCGVCPVSME